jgi:putative endonuclease
MRYNTLWSNFYKLKTYKGELSWMNPVKPSHVGKYSISNGTQWFYTYVLICEKTGTFYVGATSDLKKRLEQHRKGEVFYTRNRGPVKLVYCEACLNRDDSFRRERYLKSGMGKRYIRNRIKGGLTG